VIVGILGKVRGSKKTQDRVVYTMMLAPTIILLVLLNLYPLVMDVQSSLFRIKFLTREMTWVGLDHYVSNFKSPMFWETAWRSVKFTVGGVSLQIIGGMAIALLLHQELKGRGLARSLLLLPYVVPYVAVAIQWKWMLNPLTGMVAYITHDVLGLVEEPVHWFGNPDLVLISVIVVAAWRFVPFMVIMFLARLQTTPIELYDAAKIDGANWLREFMNVTLPWLAPTIIVATLLRMMWLFKNFAIIFLLTGGGPLDYTTTLPVYIYNTAFTDYRMGKAAALSILMLFVQLPIIIIYLRRYARAEERITL
jgi:multiple sugar transport system permease protein